VPDPNLASEWADRGAPLDLHQSRDIVHCKCCGLVQYRTNKDNCRRCLRNLPPKAGFLLPTAEPQDAPGDDCQLPGKSPNLHAVKKIGKRVQLLREAREMTQGQLQAASKVSRSYLSRIESGQMTPGLRTLEKLSVALGVDLNSFFVPVSKGEALLRDPYIQKLQPFFQKLDWEQWQFILKRLAAIHNHAVARHTQSPLLLEPKFLRKAGLTRQPDTPDSDEQSLAG
jgi:transcriptional regulator with XRE-family HTH domain